VRALGARAAFCEVAGPAWRPYASLRGNPELLFTQNEANAIFTESCGRFWTGLGDGRNVANSMISFLPLQTETRRSRRTARSV
jgi:hypothetical protein